jgi:flavin reductase (DIM6/NTAB) family NADH-FMN oxidoreductase RutF
MTSSRNASVTEKDLHYYEPAKGHGLKHDPFNAIIAPRPIGWISSRDTNGNVNLAPYSFFNAFCYKPPIIGFSSNQLEGQRRQHPGDEGVRLEPRD